MDQDGVDRKDVLVEDEDIGNRLGRKPDVYDESRSIGVEAVMFYGTGEFEGDSISQIRDEVIGAYRNGPNKPSKVWVVLENIAALTHIRRLARLENYFGITKAQTGFSVRFLVLDLNEEKLIPLHKLIQKTRDLEKICSP